MSGALAYTFNNVNKIPELKPTNEPNKISGQFV